MTTLVFGGSGFIGRAIVKQLLLRDETFVIADLEDKIGNVTFIPCDVTSSEQTLKLITEMKPTTVINLAARTDDSGINLNDYAVNYMSVANIVNALQKSNNLSCHFFHFSTQYVIGPNAKSKGHFDYVPYTTYGESKMVAELVLISSMCSWTIIRPTAVWGPFHPGYPKTIWPLIRRKIFVQPNTDPKRSYIFVDKLAEAFFQIKDHSLDLIGGRVFYLGNRPESQRVLFDAWEKFIEGGKSWTISKTSFEFIYKVARILIFFGFKFPLNKTRYEIFTKDYLVDLQSTHELIGEIAQADENDYLETFTWYSKLS